MNEKEYKFELYDDYVVIVWWDIDLITFAARVERKGKIEFQTDLLEGICDPKELETILGYEIPEDIVMQLIDDFDNSKWPDSEEYFILEMFRV